MAESLIIKARGLSRYADPLSERPPGSLNAADNVVIDQTGLFSPRRGFERVEGTLTNGQAKNIISYNNEILTYSKGSGSEKIISKYDSVGDQFTAYSGYTSTLDYIKHAEMNGNLYVTSSSGVNKLAAISGSFVESGLPAALHFTAADANSGSAVTANQWLAYRCVWGFKDANENLLLGAPSNAVVFQQGGADNDVTLTIPIPAEILTTNYFVQVYKTSEAASSAALGDEYKLVYEAFPTSTDLSNKYLTVVDQTPDDLQTSGTSLYTNGTREGIQASNYQPPQCSDITVFNNHMFFADLSYKQSISLQLLATGATAAYGLEVDDTITIVKGATTEVYTAKSAENSVNKQFKVFTGGWVTSPATDIRDTAQSLCKIINSTSAVVYAYYESTEYGMPGLIRLEEKDFSSTAFTVQASSGDGNSWSPNIETAQSSTNEELPNGLAWSKMNEPEAVPLVNNTLVGSKNYPIKRIIALRDSLFIFKGDGIWRLTGTGASNFSVEAFDSSAKIIAPNTVCVLNNQVVGLFDQGVCLVSESGVQIISHEIEGDLRDLIGSHLASLASLSFGFAYETDRKYFLWLPILSTDTYPTEGYCYNTVTDSWTVFDRSAWAGLVNPADDRLYIAGGGVLYLSKERKNATFSDYADEQVAVTVTLVSTTTLTLSSVTGLTVGDMYVEDDTKFARITAISTGANTITVETDLDWTTGSREVRKQYVSTLEWNPVHLNTPGHMKQWFEWLALLTSDFNTASVYFKTDQDSGWEGTDLVGYSSDAWGLFNWGEAPWGGGGGVEFAHRTYIPRTKQRSATMHVQLSIDTTYTPWEMSGFELTYRDAGMRLLRR